MKNKRLKGEDFTGTSTKCHVSARFPWEVHGTGKFFERFSLVILVGTFQRAPRVLSLSISNSRSRGRYHNRDKCAHGAPLEGVVNSTRLFISKTVPVNLTC